MITILYPWLLLLILLPLVSVYLLPKLNAKNTNSALSVPFFSFLQKQFATSSITTHRPNIWARLIAWLVWVLLVIGASGPVWLGKPITQENKGRSIMMAIDLSGSMAERDMEVNGRYYRRFDVVKSVASQFILDRKGDRLGLILFGSQAYLRSPLTPDNIAVAKILQNAVPGLAGQKTAVGDAIGLAIKKLDHAPKQNRVLILMTDGRSNAGVVSPLKAAQMAKQSEIRIYTIGLGNSQRQGLAAAYAEGPDNAVLQKIAKETGGQFFYAGNAKQLKEVYQTLDKIESSKQKAKLYRPMMQLYPYPLGIALLLSLLLSIPFLFNRRRRSL
ncbi:VWA domain-containing protein [Francisellaceae bacterium]|nr:VWA domain-containing protein [Francisellaceae bacterium]